MIYEQYPPAWTHVYTHGSGTNVIQNGDTGIAIYFPNSSKETASAATKIHYSNYKAQSQSHWRKSSLLWTQNKKSVIAVFLTDTLSVLQALTNNTLPHLAKALQLLSNNCRVALQWIPDHCDVSGHEQADKLAKEGATVSYQKRQPSPKQLCAKSREGCLPPS